MWLKDINVVITKFLKNNVLPLPDLKLCDVLIWMAPTQWWNTLKMTKEPNKMSLQDVIKYFETLKLVITSIRNGTFKKLNGSSMNNDKKKGKKYKKLEVVKKLVVARTVTAATPWEEAIAPLSNLEKILMTANSVCVLVATQQATLP